MLLGARTAAWSGKSDEQYWGCCFTAIENNTTFSIIPHGTSSKIISILASSNGKSWSEFPVRSTASLNAGDKIFLRAGASGNTGMADANAASANYIRPSKPMYGSGNIMSLLNGDEQKTTCEPYAFMGLFNGSLVKTSPDLCATTIQDSSYFNMFRSSALERTPRIFAETCGTESFRSMFYSCQNLTSITEMGLIPAAYRGAFEMFSGCTSLEEADLCFTSIGVRGLQGCFYGCSSLRKIKVHFNSFPAGGSIDWVNGVSEYGEFHCPAALGTNETISRGPSACPVGWTVINDV